MKFLKFLNSLRTSENASLLESVEKGYKSIYLGDVTIEDLSHRLEEKFPDLFKYLRDNWIQGNPEREHDIRVGSVDIHTEEDGMVNIVIPVRWKDDIENISKSVKIPAE